jgi:putative restriction endonuclease
LGVLARSRVLQKTTVHANDRDSIQDIVNKTGRAIVPVGFHESPHPQFLKWHRENSFKH